MVKDAKGHHLRALLRYLKHGDGHTDISRQYHHYSHHYVQADRYEVPNRRPEKLALGLHNFVISKHTAVIT